MSPTIEQDIHWSGHGTSCFRLQGRVDSS